MSLLAALAIHLAVPLQEETEARTLFDKARHSVECARSLEIESFIDYDFGDQKMAVAAIGKYRTENVLRITIRTKGNGREQSLEIYGDGQKKVEVEDGRIKEPEDLPQDYLVKLLRLYSHTGFGAGTVLVAHRRATQRNKNDLPDITQECDFRDFKKGPDEKMGDVAAHVLTYTVAATGEDGGTSTVKMWIDPKALLPMKFETRLAGSMQGTVVEVLKFTLNPTFPDHTFLLPEKKKD